MAVDKGGNCSKRCKAPTAPRHSRASRPGQAARHAQARVRTHERRERDGGRAAGLPAAPGAAQLAHASQHICGWTLCPYCPDSWAAVHRAVTVQLPVCVPISAAVQMCKGVYKDNESNGTAESAQKQFSTACSSKALCSLIHREPVRQSMALAYRSCHACASAPRASSLRRTCDGRGAAHWQRAPPPGVHKALPVCLCACFFC